MAPITAPFSRKFGLALAEALLLLGGAAALAFPKLAIFAVTASFVALIAWPSGRRRWVCLLAFVVNIAATTQFIVVEAAPGVVEGGVRAMAKGAVSQLRAIAFAQNVAREQGLVDPDHDGIGSALTLDELATGRLRDGTRSVPLMLRWRETAAGTFERDGYLFVVYLPTRDGQATANGGPDIDEEWAERRYVAYAWPKARGHGERPAFFIDEHERIFWTKNPSAYFGDEGRPAADAALSVTRHGPRVLDGAPGDVGHDLSAWQPWRNKQPLVTLPGDRAR